MTLAVDTTGAVVPVRPKRTANSWTPEIKVSGADLESVMAEFSRQLLDSWNEHGAILRGAASAPSLDRLTKLRALVDRGATEGEREAARRAIERIVAAHE